MSSCGSNLNMFVAKTRVLGTVSAIGLIGSVLITAPTAAQTLTTLVNFNGSNGSNSYSSLIQTSDGSLYGTTYFGGVNNKGTVFKVTPTGTLTTLTNFNGTNGTNPAAELTKSSDNNFYGTATGGGIAGGYGTVFKVTPSGILTTLVNFNYTNGFYPFGGLVQGSDGNFYGNTTGGGTSTACYGAGCGTIFKTTPSGTLTTLVNLNSVIGGYYSYSSLTKGSDGNFYGYTAYGGSGCPNTVIYTGCGTLFKVTPSGIFTTIFNFNNANGKRPNASLVQGSDGNFYGTTSVGGSSTVCGTDPLSNTNLGCGTVFKITPSGNLTTLVNFNNSNGFSPGKLIQASDGNFYGTTGGDSTGQGTIFKMTPSGTLTTLIKFSGSNGTFPYGGLLQGNDGNFYGTTVLGGSSTACTSGCGTVFKLTLALPPTFLGFSPLAQVPTKAITISGTGFTGATAVTFSGIAATSFTVNSATQITATVPTTATNGAITVTTPAGSVTSSTNFAVLPGIQNFSPTSGAVGTQVTINGGGFVDVTKVKFNGVNASFSLLSVNKIKATVPASATTGKIQVQTNNGTAQSPANFTVTP